MDMQNVSNLEIPEGEVRTIHDKDSRLLWGRVHYDTKYAGDTFQQTYSGKNLLDGSNPTFASQLTSSSLSGNTITISTTNTSTQPYCRWEIPVSQGDVVRLNTIIKNSNGMIARQVWDGSSWGGYVSRNYTDGTSISSLEYTATSGIEKIAFYFYPNTTIPTGAVSASYGDAIITKNNSNMSYEPYTGSTSTQITPSPNPDYPQDINVVTGAQTVVVRGKNIRPNNTVTGVGAIYRNNNALYFLLKAGTYTVSYKYTGASNKNRPLFYVKDLNWNLVTSPNPFSSNSGITYQSDVYGWGKPSGQYLSLTFTLLDDYYVQIVVQNGAAPDMTDMQVESGSTATPYESYQSTTKKVNLTSKNLFNFNNGTLVWAQGTQYSHINDSNSCTMTATGTTGAQMSRVEYTGLDSSKSYTLSGKAKKLVAGSDGVSVLRVGKYYSDDGINWTYAGSSLWNQSSPVVGTEYSFSGTVTGHMGWRFLFYNNAGTPVTIGESSTYYDIQFEEGSTATSYQEYYNYELCKIGTYQDYIYKSGDDWYAHKACGNVVLDGSDDEGWLETGYNRVRTSSTFGLLYNSGSSYGYYANRLINANSETVENSFNVGASAIFIKCTSKTSSVANWKTWLSSNNLIIYALLATPTDTKITDATLIGQLNAVHQWLTRYGYYGTVSTSSPSILPMIIDRTNL